MSVGQWLIWLVPETVKTLLITYGIFGFEFKKWRWWLVVAAVSYTHLTLPTKEDPSGRSYYFCSVLRKIWQKINGCFD